MRPSALRQRLSQGLRDFAWDEWAQMGVLAAPRRRSPWAQDPEALVIFTLEVARDDPRLFDEVLDWLVVNETLLSVRRLRSMCRGSEDRRLLDATLGWVAQFRPRARLKPRVEHPSDTDLLPLFRELSTPARSNDPAFAAAGLLRPVATPSGKAGHPDLRAPINLIFRLRQLLGVSARAETCAVELAARYAPRYLVGDRIQLSLERLSYGFELRLGPLLPDGAQALVRESELPVIGPVIQRVSDHVAAEPADQAGSERLRLRIDAGAAGSG